MGREALRPNSVTPGEFYDFKGDESAFPELGVDKVSWKSGEIPSMTWPQEDVVHLASWQPEIHWNVQTSPGKVATRTDGMTDGGLCAGLTSSLPARGRPLLLHRGRQSNRRQDPPCHHQGSG